MYIKLSAIFPMKSKIIKNEQCSVAALLSANLPPRLRRHYLFYSRFLLWSTYANATRPAIATGTSKLGVCVAVDVGADVAVDVGADVAVDVGAGIGVSGAVVVCFIARHALHS